MLSQRKQPPLRAAGAGFTLVEILVVLVILGAISAIVIPQIGTRNDLRAAAASRMVMSDLIYAQNLAISTQRPMYVRFSSTGYGVYDTGAGATAITHPVNKSPFTVTFGSNGTSGLSGTAIDSYSFDGSSTLVFDEMGAPYSYNSVSSTTAALAASGQVVVRSGDYLLRIDIEPFTGEMTVTRE